MHRINHHTTYNQKLEFVSTKSEIKNCVNVLAFLS